MKNVIIISPSLKVGGIQRMLSELANYWAAFGYKVHFITCFASKPLYKLNSHVNLVEYGRKRREKEGKLSQLKFYWGLIKFLRRYVARKNVDFVLTLGDIMGPLVLLSCLGLKKKIIIGDRTSPDFSFPFMTRFLKRMLYPLSYGYVAQTTLAANYRSKEFKNKLRLAVVPNGIRDIELYDVERKNWVSYLGRFSWEKNPEILIRAFAKVDCNNWLLQMAGEGPLLEKMKCLARELSIEDRVVFHGQVRDVDLFLAQSSIFVLPSLLEGFPNALCEAMKNGLPCICFDSIPYEDIFENNVSGIAVKQGDEVELTKEIERLMKDMNLRFSIGSKATEQASQFTIESAAQKIIELSE